MMKCNRCEQYGMYFERRYSPAEYFEGDPHSDIWIVGMNPAGDLGHNDERPVDELNSYFDDMESIHPYFQCFKQVSPRLYDNFGKAGGVGHTDIVKCFSKKFPPDGSSRSSQAIVANCTPYFREQLSRHCPKMIICNGSIACKTITDVVPKIGIKDRAFGTHYYGKVDGKTVVVVLCGFIRRIDNFSRRRLGLEIEQLLVEIGYNT